MLLRNYYNLLRGWTIGAQLPVVNTTGRTHITLRSAPPTNVNDYSDTGLSMWGILSTVATYNGEGVWLGTGDAAPSLDDYSLSGDLITTLTTSSAKTFGTDEEGNDYYEIIITATNGSGSEITVSECMLVGGVTALYGSGALNDRIAIDRTVLDSPVTIPANGGIAQIKYRITMHDPTPETTSTSE